MLFMTPLIETNNCRHHPTFRYVYNTASHVLIDRNNWWIWSGWSRYSGGKNRTICSHTIWKGECLCIASAVLSNMHVYKRAYLEM